MAVPPFQIRACDNQDAANSALANIVTTQTGNSSGFSAPKIPRPGLPKPISNGIRVRAVCIERCTYGSGGSLRNGFLPHCKGVGNGRAEPTNRWLERKLSSVIKLVH